MVLQVTKRVANIANNKYRVKKQSECFLISETFWLFFHASMKHMTFWPLYHQTVYRFLSRQI